jgi:hypothetical protein
MHVEAVEDRKVSRRSWAIKTKERSLQSECCFMLYEDVSLGSSVVKGMLMWTVQILRHVWQRRAEQILQDNGIKCADDICKAI